MADDTGFDDPVPALRRRLDALRSELRRAISGLDDPQGQACWKSPPKSWAG